MNFREEYKNSIEIMSPSAEQLERMKKNILEQAKTPEKKAIPFKKIAYIGSAVAACAVISVAAINIVPRLTNGSADLTAADSSTATADMAEGGNLTADFAMDAEAAYEGFSTADTETEVKSESHSATTIPAMNGDFVDVMEDAEYDIFDEVSDNAEKEPVLDGEASDDIITDSEDSAADSAFTPSATTTGTVSCVEPAIPADAPTSTDSDEPVIDEVEDEFAFELSADLATLILNNEEYILTDDGQSPPAGDLISENWFAPDGTEYWFDRYGDDYLVLLRDNGNGGFEVLGGYKKAE